MGEYFQSRKNKWEDMHAEHKQDSPPQNSLLLFCDLILKYEKYKPHKEEHSEGSYSPPISEGGASDSYLSESDHSLNDNSYNSNDDQKSGTDNETDSWDLITCHCMKPFRGRPMIECTLCGTWVHMSCAKVRPTHVPDVFICQFCRSPGDRDKRRSSRRRSDDRRMFATQ
ncbi:hypothetical protein JTE90_021759 [Oedothorax gibbosus]|uniref:Zinc finger PHD-type domain-containing protein n=1 Tax=Oedothorax gibbosus TaxID=931172 RepID=A0AAV6TYK5_9ARAC|nr:hypothetical protein JTE90_021759 [Oedothorax gibbosus]